MDQKRCDLFENELPGWVTYVENHPTRFRGSTFNSDKKAELLALAGPGVPRPKYNTPLGGALFRFTYKGSRPAYDPIFDAAIREKAPHWFRKRLTGRNQAVAGDKKKQLLEMAQRGEARPSLASPLGIALTNYINKKNKAYDPDFDAAIHTVGAAWFIMPRRMMAVERKKQLLHMAEQGEPVPSKGHPLYKPFVRYTTFKQSSYDAVFDAEIRRLAPHWFIRRRLAA